MSAPESKPPHQKEITFRSYSQNQGKYYAQVRLDYHPSVYETVLNQHMTTGGQLDTVLDIGCGPGNAVRNLAPHFAHGIGLDPSEGMIATARSLGGTTSTSEIIRFEVSTAEELGMDISPPITPSSVDLIIAGNAAHWFDMPHFWATAARVLKPGGSVALWASGHVCALPSMPNAVAIQKAIDDHEERYLKPYLVPGNLITRDCYRSLPLPWTVEPPVAEFDKQSLFRKDWRVDEEFHVGTKEVDMDTFELMMGTSSPVTRWREANPDAVGTEGDILRILRRDIERLLQEAGVEKGKETVRGTAKGVVLVVKKHV